MISLYDVWKSREPLVIQHGVETHNYNKNDSDDDCENASNFVMI